MHVQTDRVTWQRLHAYLCTYPAAVTGQLLMYVLQCNTDPTPALCLSALPVCLHACRECLSHRRPTCRSHDAPASLSTRNLHSWTTSISHCSGRWMRPVLVLSQVSSHTRTPECRHRGGGRWDGCACKGTRTAACVRQRHACVCVRAHMRNKLPTLPIADCRHAAETNAALAVAAIPVKWVCVSATGASCRILSGGAAARQA
jgi:hypothetical protein